MGFEADRLIEEERMSEFERCVPDFDDWIERGGFKRLRKSFVWTDKQGVKHKLADIDDMYLSNIINFLKRIVANIPDMDSMPIGSEGEVMVSNEQLTDTYEYVIDFLKWERKQRVKEATND